MNWTSWADKALTDGTIDRDDALTVLRAPDDEVLALTDAAFRVRREFYGREVNLHIIQNAKSGACSEDCSFCSQSGVATGEIPRYPLKSVEEIVAGAREAVGLGAVKYCTVISGRSPTEKDMDVFCAAFRAIKQEASIHLCVSPGLLTPDQARRLKEAGADRINHNLETSRRFFPSICATHTYDERVETIRHAQAAGLEVCCGGLIGMGETLDDRVDLAFALRELGVNSIPVNFFNPRPGTSLERVERLSPHDGLRALAMFRFVNPRRDIRAAGGREVNLGHLQVLALYIANSIFTQGYLTTEGQGCEKDRALLRDAGFCVAKIEA